MWTPAPDWGAVLAGGVAVLSLLWWLCTRHPPGLPPTPGLALPLLGHLHLMRRDPRGLFRAWRRRYGDVFCLYMGSRLMVVVNGFPAIREAFVKAADVFSDRPDLLLSDLIGVGGVINTSGSVWKEQRKACVEILRHLGMGKNVLALRVQEEITHYVTAIHRLQGAPTDLHKLTTVSVSNNICSIVFGRRYDYDDPVFSNYLDRMDDSFKIAGAAAALHFFPFLRHLPGDLLRMKRLISNVLIIRDAFLQPQLDSHKQTADEEDEARDFIHAYLRERKKNEDKGQATSLSDDFNLLKSTGDLFVAGSETTTTGISWTLLVFLHHPEVQDRCYKELCDVIGTNRPPAMSDRPRMTYLEATIMEVLRACDIVPLSLQHTPAYDVTFRGYVIPKNAIVIPCLDSVLSDPEIWGDPENFRPERFIGPDNKMIKPEEFIPFGVGRRVCLGESLARMELFLYLSTLVQHFRFLPPEDGQLPTLDDGIMGVVHSPLPYRIRAIPRE